MPRCASTMSLAFLFLCLPACTYPWQGTPLRSTLHPSMDAEIGAGDTFTPDLVFARARTSGDEIITLAVDTASPGLLLDPKAIERLSPDEQRARRVTLVLGDLTLEGVPFVQSTMTSLRLTLPAVGYEGIEFRDKLDGVIGLPSFGNVRLVFDFPVGPLRSGRLRVTPRGGPLLGETLRYRIGDDGFPRIEARVNEKPITFILDTGYSEFLMFESAEGLPIVAQSTGVTDQYTTLLGIHSVERAKLEGIVELGPIRVDRPTVRIGGPFPPLLGVQFFRGYRITFDHPARVIAIEPLEAE